MQIYGINYIIILTSLHENPYSSWTM